MKIAGVPFSFRPRLIDALRGYTRARLVADVRAGLTVGVVALPLAIGLGIASGVSPGAGLYTAIIGGFIVSALGGSRVQIGGPAGAFVGLVYAVITQYGLPNLLICTAMAGVFLFALGAARLGTLVKFIPHPVTTGFTCGIGVTIMLTQVKDFLGLRLAAVPAEFFAKIDALAHALPTLRWLTVGVGLATVVAIAVWPKRWARYLPGYNVAVVAVSLVVYLFRLPVDTIASRFPTGAFPDGLPKFQVPAFDWVQLPELMGPALAITVLGAIAALLSAVVADGMIDDRHDSNQELMAQGIANFVAPFFGGIPVTGVITRTVTNIRNGAGSPIAGMVHALTLLLIVLLAAPLAKFIPLAVLGGVLIVVACKMVEWDEFVLIGRQPWGDAAVFLVTFALTTCFDLTVAVKYGLILAAALFIKRVADTTQVAAHDEAALAGQGHERVGVVPPGVIVYRVFGALLFGAADKLDTVIRRAGGDTRVIILHLAAVTAMDSTALHSLDLLHEKLRRHGRHLILSGPHTQPYFAMDKAGFLDAVGADNIVADLPTAITRAQVLLGRME